MNNWKKTTLGEVIEVLGGGTPKTSIEEYWNGNIFWLSVKDFVGNTKYVYNTEKKISEKGLKNSSTRLLEKDDIVISARGTVGELAMIPYPMAFNQSCYGLRGIKNIIEQSFLYYLLLDSIKIIKQNTHGAVFDTITKETFNRIEINLPHLDEQKRIADVLSALDDKIEINNKINENLEAQAQAIFKQWFVDEAKEDWEVGVLGDILELIESGSRPKGGIDPNLKDGIASIGAESINGIGIYDFSKTKYVNKEFYKSMNRGLIKDYDILIYKDGAYIGRKGMFGNGFPFETALVNEHVFILRTNNRLNQLYLYFALEQEKLKQLNTNSAQPGLNQTSMKSLKILIPPKNILDRFEETIKPLIDKILYNSKENKTISELRDSLLPKLMNGDVRV